MCDRNKIDSDSYDISNDITQRCIFGTIIGICNVVSIILSFLVIYSFYIRYDEYKKSAYFSIAFFMVLTDLIYQTTVITTIVPASYFHNFTTFHVFNKSNWFTKPFSTTIMCICCIIFDTFIIILRRLTPFNRWINFSSLYIDRCFTGDNYGFLDGIPDLLIYSSFGTPVVVLIFLIITYYKLKKAKTSIHIEEKNEALALENATKEDKNSTLKTLSPKTPSKNMKNILRKYEIESEMLFLFQQMILCITVSIGMSTIYVENPLKTFFGSNNLYFGVIRVSTCQISFSSLSICLIIFNRSIRDDITELFKKFLYIN
uniref:G_PROTEIN_RECEP_F1_2 domain-containing protein n=1 Tax=Strongyloides venezuelensis TaxID=75913 RepID=A0A0K0FIS2_STRVS